MLVPITPAPTMTTDGIAAQIMARPRSTKRCVSCKLSLPRDREVRLPHILDLSRYVFSPYAVPTLVTAALMLLFGARVLARGPSRMAGAFFAMTAAAAVWLVAFAFMYCAKDAVTALFWSRVAYFGVPFLAPSIYHFT